MSVQTTLIGLRELLIIIIATTKGTWDWEGGDKGVTRLEGGKIGENGYGYD